jgi:hypothetical protein
MSLVDHGGFSNLLRTSPDTFQSGQSDAGLQTRAYAAAWLHNALAMAFFNVTNPEVGNVAPFTSLNSTIGRKFPLGKPTNIGFGEMTLSTLWGQYLPLPFSISSLENSSRPDNSSSSSSSYEDPRAVYPNPFKITVSNFSLPQLECQGAGAGNLANMSNIAIACGLMYGAARRLDIPRGTSGSVPEPGSWWLQPLLLCYGPQS